MSDKDSGFKTEIFNAVKNLTWFAAIFAAISFITLKLASKIGSAIKFTMEWFQNFRTDYLLFFSFVIMFFCTSPMLMTFYSNYRESVVDEQRRIEEASLKKKDDDLKLQATKIAEQIAYGNELLRMLQEEQRLKKNTAKRAVISSTPKGPWVKYRGYISENSCKHQNFIESAWHCWDMYEGKMFVKHILCSEPYSNCNDGPTDQEGELMMVKWHELTQ